MEYCGLVHLEPTGMRAHTVARVSGLGIYCACDLVDSDSAPVENGILCSAAALTLVHVGYVEVQEFLRQPSRSLHQTPALMWSCSCHRRPVDPNKESSGTVSDFLIVLYTYLEVFLVVVVILLPRNSHARLSVGLSGAVIVVAFS